MAVADQCRRLVPDCTIRFVGAKGRLEEEVVPRHGYELDLLWISGFDRRISPENLVLPFKVIRSFMQARSILRHFGPDSVICAGGFVSWPVGRAALAAGIPLLLMESNALPGKVVRMLAPRARSVHVAFEKAIGYLPGANVRVSGNPIRKSLLDPVDRVEARRFFGLDPQKPTLLAVGGSQGARSINRALEGMAETLLSDGLQLIWQTGRSYAGEEVRRDGLFRARFIHEMELAYAAADLVLGRAGAMTVSELKVVGKPSILVPLPTAAEDHQRVNAEAMVEAGASRRIADDRLGHELYGALTELLAQPELLRQMGENGRRMAMSNADDTIARDLLRTAGVVEI
jgi:UDP-N-acetylglucosamine--N-acetylmuramyl-(pentapeptide) pyrophosphoryl-undecaprenol N-acetylglucosamine transferase